MTETTTTYTREEILAHRKEWIAALRSGTRRQVHGYLKTSEGYCCLGVACEVADVLAVEGDYAYFFGTDNRSETELPLDTQVWLGVEGLDVPSNPHLDVERVFEGLTSPQGITYFTPDFTPVGLNDDMGLTFIQIADMIEYFGFKGDELGFK